MTAEPTYAELLASKGVSLRQLEINDIALQRADALAAVEILRGLPLPILGGDVYLVRGDRTEFAYAMWHCDPRDGETGVDYTARSHDEARKYIAAFPHRDDETPLFVLSIYRR